MGSPPTSALSDFSTEAINVVVRCRGRNDKEIAAKSSVVVDVPNKTGTKEVNLNTSDDTSVVGKISSTKTFLVDQVFGPGADQDLIFEGVASPLFDEFLKGFNCTVFAYGQTGTGKTYTMCGDDKLVNGSYSPNAGIIPRVLFNLFEKLENDTSLKNDFIVKCSLVEIYNESLKDLLNPRNNRKELKIYEECIKTLAGKPDKTAVYIKDLEEYCVKNARDGLQLLNRGLNDRKTSSTNMNKTSSRSHTIFSLSLFKKEGDTEYRHSKMNLVDLAGSENISRSGATEQQAKEAGSINRSLLSLGKVINALVDNKLPPYRDSKLTRLLKDSLGGETKTVLIANISPSKMDCDETAKTLEYASKAKNVMNTPQVGNLILKNIVVKDLVDEVSRLRKDLIASWSKDGVTIDKENYDQLKKDLQHYKNQVTESNRKIDFTINQNKTLNANLNHKIQEHKDAENSIKELRLKNTSLSNKLQVYQENEKKLIQSTENYKDLIDVFNSGLADIMKFHTDQRLFLQQQVHEKLQVQTSHLTSILENALNESSNADITENSKKIKDIYKKSIENFEKMSLEICGNITKSLNSRLPEFFENIKASIKNSNLISHEEFKKIENNFVSLSNHNTNFDKFLSNELITRQDTILSNYVQAATVKNEIMKKQFMNNMVKMFEDYYSKTTSALPNEIDTLRKQIEQERNQLTSKKTEWLSKSNWMMKTNSDIISSLSVKIEKNEKAVLDEIAKLSDLTTKDSGILNSEITEICKTSRKAHHFEGIEEQLSQITDKFTSARSMKDQTMNDLLTIGENLTGCSEVISANIEKDNIFKDSKSRIDNYQKMVNQRIELPERLSMTKSPVRQVTNNRNSPARRNQQDLPFSRSATNSPAKSGVISRISSRSNSRQSSPSRQNRNVIESSQKLEYANKPDLTPPEDVIEKNSVNGEPTPDTGCTEKIFPTERLAISDKENINMNGKKRSLSSTESLSSNSATDNKRIRSQSQKSRIPRKPFR